MSVVCLVEHDADGVVEASRRALAVARGLADSGGYELHAVAFTPPSDAAVRDLGAHAVSLAHVVTGAGADPFAPGAWARTLGDLADGAAAILAAGTDRGSDVLAHLATQRGAPMVANCVAAAFDGGSVALTRQRWAGSLIEDSVLDAAPALLTVAFDGVGSSPAATPVATSLRDVTPPADPSAVSVAEWVRRPGGISLADAKVVVGGGRGVGSVENFAALDELAALLGAAVGVSRVVTSLGWRPHAQQVGQTGTRITPDLYVAAGISGATQHLAGCQSAKVLVAINTDADAPIIARADYAVIGDLNVIVPALVEAIRAR